MEKLIKKSLYSPEVYRECLDRIEKLTPETRPRWGTMSAAQMLSHCAEIQEVSNGKELKNTPFPVKLFKGLVRNMVVNEKPYPKNSKTHPQYRQTAARDFETEKRRLLAALDQFVNMDQKQAEAIRHPLFGKMSPEEKGWSIYKHLDHHLTQFGV
jgi:hypothetical protein